MQARYPPNGDLQGRGLLRPLSVETSQADRFQARPGAPHKSGSSGGAGGGV